MGANASGRVALMSIHPEYAEAIVSGRKWVEFRKRPIADDVSHVLIYATLPVGSLVGWFSVEGQDTEPPRHLWIRFKDVACISRTRFFAYYSGRGTGTGIRVGKTGKFASPIPLSELEPTLRPPQSFQYLTPSQTSDFFALVDRGKGTYCHPNEHPDEPQLRVSRELDHVLS